MYNEVFGLKTEIPLDITVSVLENTVKQLLNSFDTLYSYFVGRKDDAIILKISCSSVPSYNTIEKTEAQDDIITSIIDYLVTLSDVKCITFKQPPIELIIPLYQPMIKRMVDKIHTQWRMFDYEDLVSMGNLVLVKLYKKGYYLNKRLIWVSLNNEVLLECRKMRYHNVTTSLDETIKIDAKMDSEELTYGDTIEDESYREEEEKNDEEALNKFIFEQVRSIIIDRVGVRQWDRLWRDYGKSHTTNTTQQCMRRIRDYFKEMGLTRQDFINYYRR